MSEPLLELSNPGNWEQVYDEQFVALDAPNNRYYPLSDVIVPILFTTPILAFAASSQAAQQNWRLGYWARQYIAPTGIGTGALEARQIKAYLNRTVLQKFDLLAAQYQVRLSFPYWLRRVDAAIWQYTGPISDSTEFLINDQIDLVRVDLLRIEQKINTLL